MAAPGAAVPGVLRYAGIRIVESMSVQASAQAVQASAQTAQ